MKLKRKIDKSAFDNLPEHYQALYSKSGDDYVLSVDGDEDVGALKRGKDRANEERKEALKRAKEAEAELQKYKDKESAAADDDAKKKGDIESLDASWKKKYEKLEAKKDAEIEKYKGHLKTTLVDSVAKEMASKISTAPSLLSPVIKARLQANFDGDEPKTTVLGADGTPSALTIDELKQEFLQNEEYSPILIASKASGGANSTQNGNQGGAFQGGSAPQQKLYNEMSSSELLAQMKDKVGQTE